MLYRMVGRIKRIGGRAGSEQPRVAGEKEFEAKIGGEMSGRCGNAVVVVSAVAGQDERLRLGEEARNRVATEFSLPAVAARYGALYDELAAGG